MPRVSSLFRAAIGIPLLALTVLTPAAGTADDAEPDARSIMQRATAAAGGDAWRYAQTNLMTGNATLYRDGKAVQADRYEMRRVYPRELPEVHTNTGMFKLDAYRKDQLLFSISYDGNRMYDQNGPMPAAQAQELAASSFGFSAVRFALDESFTLTKMPDDQLEGRPAYFVQVTDPAGGKTLVGVEKENFALRYVGWQTPRGWHHRLYSDLYTLASGFVQPGRVRLYYDGIKTTDIKWIQAKLNVSFRDDTFAIAPKTPDIDHLIDALQGSYIIDPAVAAADNDVPQISSHFARVSAPDVGQHTVYWQMNTGEEQALYRQVVLVFSAGDNGSIRAKALSFKNPDSYANGHSNPTLFNRLQAADLTATLPEPCDLTWSYTDNWHGEVTAQDCKIWSERRQQWRHIGTEIIAGETALRYVERGFDENNQRIFGPAKGTYYRMHRSN